MGNLFPRLKAGSYNFCVSGGQVAGSFILDEDRRWHFYGQPKRFKFPSGIIKAKDSCLLGMCVGYC